MNVKTPALHLTGVLEQKRLIATGKTRRTLMCMVWIVVVRAQTQTPFIVGGVDVTSDV
jgi:hypothetical protein